MRTLSLIVVVAVVVASCTPSRVDPDAEVVVSGRFVGGDGAPLSERTVDLHVDPGPYILLWVPAILATLGAACATELCGADHATRTDPAGRFRFDLRGSDVSGSLGEEVDLLAAAAGPGTLDDQSGPSGRIRFVVQAETVALPEVALWSPPVGIAPDGVTWEAVPTGDLAVSRYEALFQSADGAAVWRADATPEGLRVDPRVLEDSAGGVAGVAALTAPGQETVRGIELRTGTRRYRSTAGPPASRGASCRLVTDDGATTPLSPCPFTDGDLATAPDVRAPCPEEGSCPRTVGVEIELGAAGPVELVVVRGCDGCRVEVGGSGTQLTSGAVAVELDTTADAVRVTGDVTALQEVSVWDGPTAGGLEAVAIDAPVGDPAEVVGGQPVEPVPDGEERPAWLLLLATLLLGVAVGAVAMALVGRRPATCVSPPAPPGGRRGAPAGGSRRR